MTIFWSMSIKSNTGNNDVYIRDRTIGGISDDYFNQTGIYLSEKQLRNIYWGRSPARAKYITIKKENLNIKQLL